LLISRRGIFGSAEGLVYQTQVAKIRDRGGVQGECVSDRLHGLLVTAGLVINHAKEMMGVRVARINLQDSAV
jgi:hypothetical protein